MQLIEFVIRNINIRYHFVIPDVDNLDNLRTCESLDYKHPKGEQ